MGERATNQKSWKRQNLDIAVGMRTQSRHSEASYTTNFSLNKAGVLQIPLSALFELKYLLCGKNSQTHLTARKEM